MSVYDLKGRIKELGMPKNILARRSGISVSTLNRILNDPERATIKQLRAIAERVGLKVRDDLLSETASAHTFRKQVATKKALYLAKKLQGTSALEAQGVDRNLFDEAVEQNKYELMTGPRRQLWG